MESKKEVAKPQNAVLGELVADVEQLTKTIKQLATYVQRLPLRRYLQLIEKPQKLMWFNLLAGISFGVGSTLGAALVITLLICILSKLEAIPVIGHYIALIVREIQRNLRRP